MRNLPTLHYLSQHFHPKIPSAGGVPPLQVQAGVPGVKYSMCVHVNMVCSYKIHSLNRLKLNVLLSVGESKTDTIPPIQPRKCTCKYKYKRRSARPCDRQEPRSPLKEASFALRPGNEKDLGESTQEHTGKGPKQGRICQDL